MKICPYCHKLGACRGIGLHVINAGAVVPLLLGGLQDHAPVFVVAALIISWTASALAIVLYFNADANT